MCIRQSNNPSARLLVGNVEIITEVDESPANLPENTSDENIHPLVIPNFTDPMARLFPPNFYNTVMSLSEELIVPPEFVFMVMCGQSEDFIAMAEDIIETPLGQPVEYVMPYPLDAAWKYLVETHDPSLESDNDEEQTAQPEENLIPMDYVRQLLGTLRSRLVMKKTVADYMQSLEEGFGSSEEVENSDKENGPEPIEI